MLQAHEAAPQAAQETVDIGELVLHHTADAYSFGLEGPFHNKFVLHWEKWPDVHLGPLTLNLTPTKHVIFMVIAAALVFLTLWVAGRALKRQQAHEKAPKGFAAAIEGLVLFIRNDIAIANIGHDGAKFAPFVTTLFFFILYMNLLGLVPWGASPTGNLAVTGGLAILMFIVVEVSGMMKLGAKGYMRTIFMEVPGMAGAGRTGDVDRPGADRADRQAGQAVRARGPSLRQHDGRPLRHSLPLRDHLPVRLAADLELRDRDHDRGAGHGHHAAGAVRGGAAGVCVRAVDVGVHRDDAGGTPLAASY